ncbi:hypothetical protein [Thermoflexibacter ruber]|uniref:SpoIIAA-like n=1 Tax=Thermoflexibacter ruber TaxID=1003 RepID=A0A1I2JEC4_9BACT|nr:hypothetical protein [Thermoflexibacter ruber]SFF53185.1 hypothetical protein SAMN04488541_10504 [Thermoflexibacter ruber]
MLHKSSFLQINSMPEINGVKIQWLADSEKMSEEDFKAEIEAEKKALEEVKPKNILADTLQMGFAIPPNLQEWHNGIIFPVFQGIGLQKLAILVSHDLFVQVSIEQLIDEEKSNTDLKTRYFDSEENAINWLKS